jgi:hypothetical protein
MNRYTTPVATLTTARCEDYPESPYADYSNLPDDMRKVLADLVADFDSTRECPCGNRIGSEFFDDDDDGMARGGIKWHPVVLVSDGVRMVALCDACDPDPSAFATKDLIVDTSAEAVA